MSLIKYSVAGIINESINPIAVEKCMGPYSLTGMDMLVLVWLCNTYRVTRVLEFGICQGHTASVLLGHCPIIAEYVGIDLRPQLFPARGIVPTVAGEKVIDDPRYRSVLTDETIEDVHRQLGTSPIFDAVIMDANHTCAATRRDTEGADPLLDHGGLRVWHDYNVGSRQHSSVTLFGVKEYIDALASGGRTIFVPDDTPRDPWKCCSLAWETKQ